MDDRTQAADVGGGAPATGGPIGEAGPSGRQAGGLAALAAGPEVGWAVAVGTALGALLVPGVFRAAFLLLAGLVAASTRCPRWLGVLLVTAAIPSLLVAAVTGSLWFH